MNTPNSICRNSSASYDASFCELLEVGSSRIVAGACGRKGVALYFRLKELMAGLNLYSWAYPTMREVDMNVTDWDFNTVHERCHRVGPSSRLPWCLWGCRFFWTPFGGCNDLDLKNAAVFLLERRETRLSVRLQRSFRGANVKPMRCRDPLFPVSKRSRW